MVDVYFNRLFEGLTFTLSEMNRSGYDLYVACVNGQLMGDKKRYVILSVPLHLSQRQEKARIDELQWESLQCRTLENSYNLWPQKWIIPRDFPIITFDVVNRNKSYSEYSNQGLPLEVIILHDPKKKTEYQHRNNINLIYIVETFSVIFRKINFGRQIAYQPMGVTPITRITSGQPPPVGNVWHTPGTEIPQMRISQTTSLGMPVVPNPSFFEGGKGLPAAGQCSGGVCSLRKGDGSVEYL